METHDQNPTKTDVDILAALETLDKARAQIFQDTISPVGSVVAHAGTYSDSTAQHWRPCAGQSVKRREYPALFAVIGTAWGDGDEPGQTFSLPDLRGMFLRGVARGTNADPNRNDRVASIPGVVDRQGGNSGDQVGSLQVDATALPNNAFRTGNESNPHNHNASASGQSAQGGPNTFDSGGNRGVNGTVGVTVHNNNQGHHHVIDSGGDAETRPINAYVNYWIRVK